jgi:hypothetical protein
MNFKIIGILIVLVHYRGKEHDPTSEETQIPKGRTHKLSSKAVTLATLK